MIGGCNIDKVNHRLYIVRSADSEHTDKTTYKVRWHKKGKWLCNCASSDRKSPCEHIHAVNYLLKLPEIMMLNNRALNGEWRCPTCGSDDLSTFGSRYNKDGSVRRFICKHCGHTCKDPSTRKDLTSKIAFVIITLDLFYKKLSYREIQDHLYQIYGMHKPVSTIRNWVLKFTKIIIGAVKKLPKQIQSTKWLGDEMVVRVHGKRMYLWNILDYRSRSQIVSILLKGRGEKEATQVIIEALKNNGGNKPKLMLTDGLGSYVGALKECDITHISNVGLADKKNNNRIERLHGSIRQFVKAKRGLKVNAAILLEGNSIYYNYIRPHMALGNRPPAVVNKKDAKWSGLLPSTRCKIVPQSMTATKRKIIQP
jgi:transposase-like protein/rubrerythrin